MQPRQHRAIARRFADDDGKMLGPAVARPKGDHPRILRARQGNPGLAHDSKAAGGYQLIAVDGADGDVQQIPRAGPIGGVGRGLQPQRRHDGGRQQPRQFRQFHHRDCDIDGNITARSGRPARLASRGAVGSARCQRTSAGNLAGNSKETTSALCCPRPSAVARSAVRTRCGSPSPMARSRATPSSSAVSAATTSHTRAVRSCRTTGPPRRNSAVARSTATRTAGSSDSAEEILARVLLIAVISRINHSVAAPTGGITPGGADLVKLPGSAPNMGCFGVAQKARIPDAAA